MRTQKYKINNILITTILLLSILYYKLTITIITITKPNYIFYF